MSILSNLLSSHYTCASESSFRQSLVLFFFSQWRAETASSSRHIIGSARAMIPIQMALVPVVNAYLLVTKVAVLRNIGSDK